MGRGPEGARAAPQDPTKAAAGRTPPGSRPRVGSGSTASRPVRRRAASRSGHPARSAGGQDRSRCRGSLMAEILRRRTPLRVEEAREGTRTQPSTVYIAPPDEHLLVGADGRLCLSHSDPVHFVRPSADLLFESGAESPRPRRRGPRAGAVRRAEVRRDPGRTGMGGGRPGRGCPFPRAASRRAPGAQLRPKRATAAWAPWAGRAPAHRQCCAGSPRRHPRSSPIARRRRATGGC